jgi:hypothetical protein
VFTADKTYRDKKVVGCAFSCAASLAALVIMDLAGDISSIGITTIGGRQGHR